MESLLVTPSILYHISAQSPFRYLVNGWPTITPHVSIITLRIR